MICRSGHFARSNFLTDNLATVFVLERVCAAKRVGRVFTDLGRLRGSIREPPP